MPKYKRQSPVKSYRYNQMSSIRQKKKVPGLVDMDMTSVSPSSSPSSTSSLSSSPSPNLSPVKISPNVDMTPVRNVSQSSSSSRTPSPVKTSPNVDNLDGNKLIEILKDLSLKSKKRESKSEEAFTSLLEKLSLKARPKRLRNKPLKYDPYHGKYYR